MVGAGAFGEPKIGGGVPEQAGPLPVRPFPCTGGATAAAGATAPPAAAAPHGAAGAGAAGRRRGCRQSQRADGSMGPHREPGLMRASNRRTAGAGGPAAGSLGRVPGRRDTVSIGIAQTGMLFAESQPSRLLAVYPGPGLRRSPCLTRRPLAWIRRWGSARAGSPAERDRDASPAGGLLRDGGGGPSARWAHVLAPKAGIETKSTRSRDRTERKSSNTNRFGDRVTHSSRSSRSTFLASWRRRRSVNP